MLYFGMSYQFDMMSENLVVYKGTKFTEYEDIEQDVEEEKNNFSILWDKALGAIPYIASYTGGLLTGFANSFLPIDFFDYSERSDAFRAGLLGGDILGAAVGMALFDAGSGGMVVGTTVVCTGVGAPVGVAIDAGSALAMGFGGLMMFNSARNVANPNRYKGSSSSSSSGSGASGGGNKPPKKEPNWSNHGHKHVSSKNTNWKDTVNSTKNGPAKYKQGTDIEKLERGAWEDGTKVINGKNWKVKKMDDVIGASDGKETKYIRVEESGGTIHGHPISEIEYNKLTK